MDLKEHALVKAIDTLGFWEGDYNLKYILSVFIPEPLRSLDLLPLWKWLKAGFCASTSVFFSQKPAEEPCSVRKNERDKKIH